MKLITLTPSALAHLKQLTSDGKKFRIGVSSGGCAGFSYMPELIDIEDSTDIMIEQDGFQFFVDRSSEMFLIGLVIDYTIDSFGSAFKFDNPLARSSCGCEKSFSI